MGARVVRGRPMLPFAALFLVPLLAMLDFCTREGGGGRTGRAWLLEKEQVRQAIINSLLLAALTVRLHGGAAGPER